MSRSRTVRGFVLKKKSLLNKDISFSIFTEEEGKLTGIAKGIRKITSRRAPHIQTGNLVEIELSGRGETVYLQNSTLISAFSQIRDDEKKTQFLYTFFFILDRLLPEHQQEHPMYQATQSFIFEMAKSSNYSTADFSLHLSKFLMQAGYVNEPKPLSELIRTVEEVINEKVPMI